MNRKVVTKSFEETQQLGFDFAKTLKGGQVIALHGDLGAGKTTFVQGLAKGLGITKNIISPTFIIMRTYGIPSGDSLNFYHVDLYRIESEHDIEGLGLLELLQDPNNIIVIEWSEKIEHLLPTNKKAIFLTYLENDRREIVFE